MARRRSRAAVQMQRVLDEYNASRPGDEEILVRVGIAEGEVVLDKGGKPFLGDGLNLAARIMGLADGGQVFTSAELAGASRRACPTGRSSTAASGSRTSPSPSRSSRSCGARASRPPRPRQRSRTSPRPR